MMNPFQLILKEKWVTVSVIGSIFTFTFIDSFRKGILNPIIDVILPDRVFSHLNIKVNIKQVGSDRIANAISIIDNKKNYIIVDFGTATTFDIIEKNYYVGGIIAPGVNLSLETLITKASLIPYIKLNKISDVIGKNTKSAVRSGFYWGYIGLINEIINLIKKKTKKKYSIILTGGLSYLFKNKLKSNVIVNKDLTMKGLLKVVNN